MTQDITKTAGKKSRIYIISAFIGIIMTLLCMAAFSALIYFFGIDRAYSSPFGTLALAIGGLLSARYAAGKIGDRGYIIGLIIGAVSFAVVTLIGMILNSGGLTLNTLFRFVITSLSSVIGGIMGVNKGRNKKYI